MPTSDAMRETLEHFRSQERKLLADLASIRVMVKSLERELGIPSQESKIPNGSNGQMIDVTVPAISGSAIGGKPTIRADESFGLTHADAAKRYLKTVGHAVSFEELATAIKKDDSRITRAHPNKYLYTSLI